MTNPLTRIRPWLCSSCNARRARPRRLKREGGLVVGECSKCGGTMQRVIEPIAHTAFAGQSMVHAMLGIKDPVPPTPKDWTPKKEGP